MGGEPAKEDVGGEVLSFVERDGGEVAWGGSVVGVVHHLEDELWGDEGAVREVVG